MKLCIDCGLEERSGRYSYCKKCHSQRSRDYYQNNKESVKERARLYRKEYYQANKNAVLGKHKEYRKNNKEAFNERDLKYQKAHPEIGRRKKARRRARLKNNAFESYTESQVLDSYGSLCHLCGLAIDLSAPRHTAVAGWENGLHIDHVIPLSKGGDDTLENVRPSHGKCNLKKGSQ